MPKEMHHQQNHEVDEWKNALILKARVPTLSPMTGDLLCETAFFHSSVCFFCWGRAYEYVNSVAYISGRFSK